MKIRVPRKLVKTVPLEELDSWVSSRYAELCGRYSIAPLIAREKRKKVEGFDTIQRLLGERDLLGELREGLVNDRYADQIRLQVKVTGKVSAVVVRNVIMRVKELPLGVHQIFIDEGIAPPTDNPSRDESQTTPSKRHWLEMMMERTVSSEPKYSLLKELLYDLTQKV
jgi:hypothetical protein